MVIPFLQIVSQIIDHCIYNQTYYMQNILLTRCICLKEVEFHGGIHVLK